MTTILSVNKKLEIKVVANLAHTIWKEHYTPIIGEDQVVFMLNKFQSENAISAQIKEGFNYFLIAHQEAYVGYFAFCLQKDALFLSKFYVLRSERGKGYGKAALKFIEAKAKNLGSKKIKLTVNKNNSNSITAYEKMGFINVESIVQDIGNGFVMDDYVLEKSIV
ncbi:GNAT family N-acetyltransferase [Maribacter sp. PR1]|uniref:GNAT family N-acetyltransferase n=1 Tax=Maribacter cobaltidurans TaxID=1178778 RepID=A0ABU7IVE3_9FLAO|nr:MULTISPECIES: GNAT family N-acetyltransferase [Maribacter]MDC6389570.1 GNAT family N-acetyltransferase [Maribacter sp. PR1]MEE1976959.1 GNAT family N-acetyltransferase [Maribacter cobaltidurans]